MRKQVQPLTPAALYARESPATARTWTSRWLPNCGRLETSPRTTATPWPASTWDEAESGRIADRPQFRQMIDEGGKATAPLPGDSRLEVLKVHPQAGARRRLQVHAPAQGHQSRLYHRVRRRLPHRQAHGGHHRERGRILLRKFGPRGRPGNAGGSVKRLFPGFQGSFRLQPHQGQRRGEGPSHPGG